ncbi:class I SAM-dependent methyltransferase [candidate division KSB1 bacterium]|nr:class I SAM-dependent methyltransferase [candidate division KSB1 bacterium]NIR72808.1 class I SAM-dependent methyltransferase [candidate division KSB1 bacterium]NIS26848.1 class I SAM-dependent methyltransferase [candidate division KSB1 bacterium]NIT73644.1 class I SAM-dependent methyltransferase [candidate division KSB1 bacterium]NIU27515.1 class I SAM-dependent methyltransferase [candidate division KSB1 bacterium]
MNPRPKAGCVSQFYRSEGYQPFLSTQSSLNVWDWIYRWVRGFSVRYKRHKIERLKSKGRILDVGCGTGEFLNEMQKNDWETVGVEKDEQACEYAQKVYGLRVSTHDLSEFERSETKFDVISFWHVLEHLYAPKQTLEICKSLLDDEGFILVALPDIASFDARFYREHWVALDAPRHLHHFVPESLRALSHSAGLELVKFEQLILDAFFNCLMSERLIMSRKLNRKFVFPVYLLRGLLIAMTSLAVSSGIRQQWHRFGSSNLYYIRKEKD